MERPSRSSRFHVLDEDVCERNASDRHEAEAQHDDGIESIGVRLQLRSGEANQDSKRLLTSRDHAVLYS